MTSGGYGVDLDAIDGYSGNLTEFQVQANKFTTHVSDADVADKSWGVVGLFTKQNYTSALQGLRDLLDQLDEGLEGASDTFAGVQKAYQSLEDDLSKVFEDIDRSIDGTAPPGGGQGSPPAGGAGTAPNDPPETYQV